MKSSSTGAMKTGYLWRELPGYMAHGGTEELVLKNIKDAIQLWIETTREFSDPVPEPKGCRLMYA
jgi:predicted RNase H-like HicB family nuclease